MNDVVQGIQEAVRGKLLSVVVEALKEMSDTARRMRTVVKIEKPDADRRVVEALIKTAESQLQESMKAAHDEVMYGAMSAMEDLAKADPETLLAVRGEDAMVKIEPWDLTTESEIDTSLDLRMTGGNGRVPREVANHGDSLMGGLEVRTRRQSRGRARKGTKMCRGNLTQVGRGAIVRFLEKNGCALAKRSGDKHDKYIYQASGQCFLIPRLRRSGDVLSPTLARKLVRTAEVVFGRRIGFTGNRVRFVD